MNLKPPLTYDGQIDKLIDKGFFVSDRTNLLSFLKAVNYYCFSAYLLPFKSKNKIDSYVPSVNINKIIGIYRFDKEISAVLFEIIGRVEPYLRTHFSYTLSLKYGSECHCDYYLFKNKASFNIYKQKVKEAIDTNKETPVVKHHKNKYQGHFPFWVIVEYFSLGLLSRFYSNLNTSNKKLICKDFIDVGTERLASWLRCLTELRNKIAHYSRLYYWNFTAKPKEDYSSQYAMDNKLFSQIYIIKYLYPDKEHWNSDVIHKIAYVIDKYKDDIDLYHIGFPTNWEDLLKVQS